MPFERRKEVISKGFCKAELVGSATYGAVCS